MNLLIKPVEGYEELVTDFYSDYNAHHEGDCGVDLFCVEDLVVPAKAYSLKMPLGICVSASNGNTQTGLYLYPRSSTGLRTPLRLSNSVGIIDAGYRGEIAAILDNMSDEPFTIRQGDRYFQLCAPALQPFNVQVVKELGKTSRGDNGFGSTGTM